jgi:NitT/TauT family transport system substrate-binding protein
MRYKQAILASAAGLAMASALAACSSGGSSSGSGGSGTSSKSATPLTVVYAANGAGFSDLYVGVADGIFARYGLNVKIQQVTPANLVPALLSGSAQIGGGVADGTASAILKGEKLKYVALTEGTYNLQLWATKKVGSVQALSGQTVALTTQGSETDFGLTALLKADGVNPGSVSRKYLVATPQMLSAMSSGAVAAGLFQPPTAQSLLKSGGKVVASLSTLPYAVGAYISPSSYVSAHAKVISEFQQAEQANLAFLRSHPAQAMAAIQKYNPQNSAADAKIAYDFFLHVWKKDPAVTPALIQAAFTRAAAKAGTSPPSSVTQYIDSAQASG